MAILTIAAFVAVMFILLAIQEEAKHRRRLRRSARLGLPPYIIDLRTGHSHPVGRIYAIASHGQVATEWKRTREAMRKAHAD